RRLEPGVLDPVLPDRVHSAIVQRRPAVESREVVNHDEPTRPHPCHGVQRWLAALAVATAVKHQQVERPVRLQVTPVAVAYPYPWIVLMQALDGGCTRRVAFHADDSRTRIRAAYEPGEANAATGAGLADHAATDTTRENAKQLALLWPARLSEPGAARELKRGCNTRRQGGAPRIVGRRAGCAQIATTILPTLLPRSMPMNASGARESPSTMVSLQTTRPSRIHAPTSSRNAAVRSR